MRVKIDIEQSALAGEVNDVTVDALCRTNAEAHELLDRALKALEGKLSE